MSFSNILPLGFWPEAAGVLYCVILAIALWQVPWRIVYREPGLQHLFLGMTVLISFLWQLRAGITPWVDIQLLLATVMTLMFYWPMALIGTSLALLGTSLTGKTPWDMWFVNALLTCVVPVLISHLVWRFVDRRLPDNFFVYVFVAAFGGSALAALCSGLLLMLTLTLFSEGIQWGHFSSEYFLFLPLTLPPEAVINGMIVSGLAAYMPQWVRSFDTQRYLDHQ